MNNPPIGIYIDLECPRDGFDVESGWFNGANGMRPVENNLASNFSIFQKKAA